MYYNPYNYDIYKYAHVSPPRHVGARVALRATLHPRGSRTKIKPVFALFLIVLII